MRAEVSSSWDPHALSQKESLFPLHRSIQCLDTASLQGETIQLDVLCDLLCAIYRIQKLVIKVLETLVHFS